MPYKGYWAAGRLGGGTGASDKIPGADLADKDMLALLESTDTARFYWLDDDASGSEGETVTNPDSDPGTKSWLLLGVTLPNTGLHILDSDASHDLIIKPGSNLEADREFTITTGDAARTLDMAENLKILDGQDIELHASGGEKAQLAIDTQNAERILDLSGNLTVESNSILNQDLTTDASPTFAGLTLTGGFKANLVTKTGNYTATSNDYTIICNATSGSFTITLPAVASHTNRMYHIKKIDSSANTVTVDGNGAETIDDATTAVLTTQYESITIQSDGSEWWII